MNKFLSSCLLAAVLSFAQNPWDIPAAESNPDATGSTADTAAEPAGEAPSFAPPPPPPPSPPPAPSPRVEEKPVVTEGKANFDVLRGHAYNPFGTVGAALSVQELVTYPHEINGRKFAYVSVPNDHIGYVAFGSEGNSMLLGMDGSTLILGYANYGFGVSFEYFVDKVWTSKPTGMVSSGIPYLGTRSERITNPDDYIGLNFSLPMGLYAGLGWLTTGTSYSVVIEGAGPTNDGEIKVDDSEISGHIGMIGTNYEIGLGIVRKGVSATNTRQIIGRDGEKAVDLDTYLGSYLYLGLGYSALQNENARVIVGLNNMIGANFYDKIEGADNNSGNYESDYIAYLLISPNILLEIALTNNWFAYAGAGQDITFIAGDNDRNSETSKYSIKQQPTETFFAGMRYQKSNWAVEAEIIDGDPFSALGGKNILARLGGFINF